MLFVRAAIIIARGFYDENKESNLAFSALGALIIGAFLFLLIVAWYSFGAVLLGLAWNWSIAPLFHLHLLTFQNALGVLVLLGFGYWVIERISANIRGK